MNSSNNNIIEIIDAIKNEITTTSYIVAGNTSSDPINFSGQQLLDINSDILNGNFFAPYPKPKQYEETIKVKVSVKF